MSSYDLLKELHSRLEPGQFERFLSVLLGEMGFQDVKVTGQSGDRGIDLEAILYKQTDKRARIKLKT